MPKPLHLEGRIFSKRIKETSKDRELTYGKVANAIGIRKASQHKVIMSKTNISIPTLTELANYFGYPAYALLTPSPDMLREEFIVSVQAKIEESHCSITGLAEKTNISIHRLTELLNGDSQLTQNEKNILSNTLDIIKSPYENTYDYIPSILK